MTVSSVAFFPQAMYPTIRSLHSGCNMIESETDHLMFCRSFFSVLPRMWVATSRLQSLCDALMEIGRMLLSSVKCAETRRRAEVTNCSWCLGKNLSSFQNCRPLPSFCNNLDWICLIIFASASVALFPWQDYHFFTVGSGLRSDRGYCSILLLCSSATGHCNTKRQVGCATKIWYVFLKSYLLCQLDST